MIGIAGTQYLFADNYSLTAAGRPFIKGKIMFHLQNGDFFAALFSQDKGDCEVVALEGSFLAVRTEVLKKLAFDEELFGGMHFWDMDFFMQARKQGKIIVTSDIVAKRMSHQVFDPEWHAAGRQFLQKYKNELPASCVSQIPDPTKALPVQMETSRAGPRWRRSVKNRQTPLFFISWIFCLKIVYAALAALHCESVTKTLAASTILG